MQYFDELMIFECLVNLSVDLHNLNALCQKNMKLSLVQWLVLRKIIQLPASSASALAEATGVHTSTMSPTLNRLEEMELIYVFERAKDQRRKMILVSRLGFETCRSVESKLLGFITNLAKNESLTIVDLQKSLFSPIKMVGFLSRLLREDA